MELFNMDTTKQMTNFKTNDELPIRILPIAILPQQITNTTFKPLSYGYSK